MASTLSLLKSFATGQGAGISNYFTYANDHDSNYTAIEATVNQLVAEVSGLQGPDAGMARLILVQNDLAGNPSSQGVIGQHSYSVSINGGDPTQLLVEAGQAVLANTVVQLPSQAVLTGSGGSGTRWVALDANGIPSLETAVGLQQMDVATVTWNGSQFTSGTITQLAEIYFDGDDYDLMLDRPEAGDSGTPTFPATDFRNVAHRLEEIENLLVGVKVPVEGTTNLGAIAFGGSAAAPGLVTSDGSTYEVDTGFYRAAADQIGASIAGTQLLRLVAGQLLANADGSAGSPFFGWGTDAGLGMYRIGPDRLGFTSNSVLGLELSAEQHVDSPTQPRFHVRTASAHSHAGAGIEALSFDTEITDVGGWGAAPTATWTVPTGGDGFYLLTANVHFDESSAGGGGAAFAGNVRASQIYVLSTTTIEGYEDNGPAAATDTRQSVSALVQLAAGATVQCRANQDCGGTMDIFARFAAVKLW